VIRRAAGHDYARIIAVLDWPLREMLLTCLERTREQVARDYRTALLAWASLRPHQKNAQPPPSMPDLLK